VRRERVITPDGDFVDLDWLDDGAPPDAPLLLVLHGLEGSARSHYVLGLFAEAHGRGWRAAVMNFRSCSGELNRLPRFYHSGDTDDLDAVVRLLADREPGLRLGAVGVSLGGNVLLKWLGERAESVPHVVHGACGISVPFDLEACAQTLDHDFFGRTVYTANFMRSLRRKVKEKALLHPGFVDVAAAMRARTFAAYDRVVTAPLHGFADERDYWRRASSGPWLPHIRRPTLLLNALDDPFIPARSLPDAAALPPAFLDGAPWRPRSWAERRAVEFLAALLA
jgi:predicted alpha/beta-fold hydrolase